MADRTVLLRRDEGFNLYLTPSQLATYGLAVGDRIWTAPDAASGFYSAPIGPPPLSPANYPAIYIGGGVEVGSHTIFTAQVPIDRATHLNNPGVAIPFPTNAQTFTITWDSWESDNLLTWSLIHYVMTVNWYAIVLGGALPPPSPPTTPDPDINPITGIFSLQLVTWTGDNAANRLIPTTFPLNTGSSVVWIFPQLTDQSMFRHSGMTGTNRIGVNGVSTLGGVMSFGAAGFVINNNSQHNPNILGQRYTALVFNDTGAGYMAIGTYLGRSAVSNNATFTYNSSTVVGGGMTLGDVGRTINIGAPAVPPNTGPYTVTSVNTGLGTFTVSPTPNASDPNHNHNGLYVITAPAGSSFVQTLVPAMVWVLGRQGVFCTQDMPTGQSPSIDDPLAAYTNKITGLVSAPIPGFSVGTDNDVNNSTLEYYWVAFRIPHGDIIESKFRTFFGTGTAAATDTITGLGFTPGFVGMRCLQPTTQYGGWRGPWHVIDEAVPLAQIGQSFHGAFGSIGIKHFGPGTVDFANDQAPAGQPLYGWALVGGANQVPGFPAPSPPGACDPLQLHPTNLPQIVPGVFIDITLVASGGTGPYTFYIQAGALPPGLTLTASGHILGIPTTALVNPVTIGVLDTATGCVRTRVYGPRDPSLCGPLTITGLTPAVVIGVPYTATLITTGGLAPYLYTLFSGSFPPGIVMSPDGVLSGTPTAIGVFAFILQVTDDNGCLGFLAATIAVITPGDNCPVCTTLTNALDILASRLEDPNFVHWTQAELTRYLRESLRTWNAITSVSKAQGTLVTQAGVPFYDIPVQLPALRAYTVTDAYMVGDLEYALMEIVNQVAWSGTIQYTFPDLVRALQHARDRFLFETGMVQARFIQSVGPIVPSGRYPVNRQILTLRRVAYVDPLGNALPLTRDDEWSMNAFNQNWPSPLQMPLTGGPDPMVWSVGVTPPLTLQVAPPFSGIGTFDIIGVARAAVMGTAGPCLDPTQGILLGVPDDWTWVVKFGALAILLNQQGLAHDPSRAAYCNARFRHGLQMAAQASCVLATQVNFTPILPLSLAEGDMYRRTWQSTTAVNPDMIMLAGCNLLGVGPVPSSNGIPITLDLIRNMPMPAVVGDCLGVEDQELDAVLDYAQHLAVFKEGPEQVQQTLILVSRFFAAAGVSMSIDGVSSPNSQVILDQTRQDERAKDRMLTPPPGPSDTSTSKGTQG